jgi:hypothetical protein
METLLDAMCGSSSSSSDLSTAGQAAASGGGAPAAGGSRAVVQLSALLYGTFLKQAVLATGKSQRSSSGAMSGDGWQSRSACILEDESAQL